MVSSLSPVQPGSGRRRATGGCVRRSSNSATMVSAWPRLSTTGLPLPARRRVGTGSHRRRHGPTPPLGPRSGGRDDVLGRFRSWVQPCRSVASRRCRSLDGLPLVATPVVRVTRERCERPHCRRTAAHPAGAGSALGVRPARAVNHRAAPGGRGGHAGGPVGGPRGRAALRG